MQHVMFQLIFMFQTLSAQHNGKLLQQLKAGFKRTINWNNWNNQSEPTLQTRYYKSIFKPLNWPDFQEFKKFFVLSFEMMHIEKVASDILFRL